MLDGNKMLLSLRLAIDVKSLARLRVYPFAIDI